MILYAYLLHNYSSCFRRFNFRAKAASIIQKGKYKKADSASNAESALVSLFIWWDFITGVLSVQQKYLYRRYVYNIKFAVAVKVVVCFAEGVESIYHNQLLLKVCGVRNG